MTEDKVVRVHLGIVQSADDPTPMVQLVVSPDGDIAALATNWTESNEGAAAVAMFLHTAAQAIDAELVRKGAQPSGAVNATPQRPRFNPRPAGGTR